MSGHQTTTVDYFPSAVGNVFANTTPWGAVQQITPRGMMSPNRRATGNYADDLNSGTVVAIAVGVIAAAAILSYQAGKAMSPTKNDAKTWGWIGVPVGVFTGPWGLGIMGAISNGRKGW